MFRQYSDSSNDLLQRQRAISSWENEGGATPSDPVSRHGQAVAAGKSKALEAPAIEVDATLVGNGLQIDPSLVQPYLREGKITSL